MTTLTDTQSRLVEEVLARVASDLSMITDREFVVQDVTSELASARIAGEGAVHISFKLGFEGKDGGKDHGCILVPLPEAISLAGFLMMMPDDGVTKRRGDTNLDEAMKDAMLEVANFVAGAADAAVREALSVPVKVRSEGCQGVRADVRPALVYDEGAPLVVARAKARIHKYDEFTLLAIVPPVGDGDS